MHRLSRRSVHSHLRYAAHRRRDAVAAVSVCSLNFNEMSGEKNGNVRWYSVLTIARCSGPTNLLKLGGMIPIPSWNRYESTASNFKTTDVYLEKYEYKIKKNRFLDRIFNSQYSNQGVFIRELISNANDALDRLRLLSVTEPQILEGGPELDIRIEIDQHNGIITLTDSGIGMTYNELVDSLGTIAYTWPARFMEALTYRKDVDDEFNGLGFYSTFLVANKVVVSTKSPKSDKQYVWEGETNKSKSSIVREETDPEQFIPRGTSIKLHLKRGEKGFANPDIIQRLINKHSQVVSFPISIYTWQEKGYTKVSEENNANVRWYESTASNFKTTEVHVETYEYQIKKYPLIDVIINRVYSNHGFLRELISNANDALDKLRLLSVTEPQILEGGPELDIRIQIDQQNGIITLTDSGIGMTHNELVDSLGTIAHTWPAKLKEALKDRKDSGGDEFDGLGFYSAFLVANKVVVSTKSPKSDKQYVWEGDTNNSKSSIVREETDPKKFIPRGTSIKLYLKRDDKRFANPYIIQTVINKHSQVVSFPISIYTSQEKGYTKVVKV